MISFLQMSLWASALTALICIVRAVWGRRLPKGTFRILWAVVILRMLVPLSLPVMKINFDMPVSSASDEAMVQDTVVYTYMVGEFTQAGTADHITPQTEYKVRSTAGGSLSVTEIWLLTAAAVFGAFAAAHLCFRLKVRDAIPAEINFEAGLKRQVRIKVSDRIDSPLTYGIFRPVILLPKNIYNCDKKVSEYILSHELTHIKRFDVLYKLLMALAVSLHWFNPLAWVMLVLASRDIELSCDEEVVLRKNSSGREREEYALTLIEMEEKRSFGVLQNGFGGSSVKERIKSVMQLKKASPAGKTAAVLLVAAAFTVFTVYDIEKEAFYSVTVSADQAAEVSYADPTAEQGTYYSEYVIEEFTDADFTMEEIYRSLDSGEIAVENAPLSVVEIGDSFYTSDIAAEETPVTLSEDYLLYRHYLLLYGEEEASAALAEATATEGRYETPETIMTKMYAITTADGTVVREYPVDYSLYYFSYNDPKTGKSDTMLVDLNEYSPYDYEKYGLTVSKDKGYYLYNGKPVGGFQCVDFTTTDGLAIQDGGVFLIYKEEDDGRFDETVENGMVQVNINQFCHITGARL
ncbi:MAG: M56 family metallopeptidase [Oscillospiraceae bacterium]|nr:M56 family metallopeptidase [Oscillospiraceae bacterium]